MALGDHIKLYTTTASAISAEGNSTKMHVSAVENSELVLYDKHYNNYADQYLHIHSDASFKIKYTQSTETTGKLYYSYDKITWTELQNNVYLNIIASGTTQFEYWSVYLKGNLSPSLSKTGIGTIYIVNTSSITNSEINIDGNIMSLCYMDSFITNFGCDVSYYFYRLFASQQTTNCTYNLSNLILPNKLSEYCFCEMFFNVKINSFPKFPALHLKEGCYMSMFEHQNSSTGIRYNTIILPAKYVPKNAYYNMFLNNNTTISNNYNYYNIYLYFSNYENADSIAIFGIDVNNIIASGKGHSIYFKGYSNFKPNLYGTVKSITGYIDFDATAQNPVTVVDSTKKFNTLNIYNNHNDIIASNATVLPKLNNINVSINSLVSNGLKGNRDNLFITYKSSDNITRSICYDFTNEFDFELPFNVGTVDIYLYEYDENGNIINSRYENKKINKYYTHNFSTSDLQIEAPIIYFDKSSNYDEPGYTSKKYPQIIIDFRKDNLSGPSSILTYNTDEAFIYYNISNYSFIEEQKLDTNTNNKWNNYISIRVATKTSLQNSPIIISDETFKKLHIDPSKKIYVKAKSVYKINNNIYESKETVFSTKLRNIFEKDYFAVTANGAYVLNNIILHNTDNIPVLNNLQYSFDKYNWYDINSSDINEHLLVGSHGNNTNTYQTVYLKAYGINSINLNTKLMKFVSNDNQNINVTLSGNILSLIYGDNFTDIDEPFTDFSYAFAGETNIVNARNLILPSKNLVANCYQNMFSGCSNLLYPPELPATELSSSCYTYMFDNCTSLVETPLLPALNTNAYSYQYMFWHTNKDLIFKPIYTKNFDTKDIYCYYVNTNIISSNSTNNIILNKFRNNDINDLSSNIISNLNVEYSAIPFEDQYLTMTLQSYGYGIFKVGERLNIPADIIIDYIAYSINDGESWDYTYIPANNEEIIITTPSVPSGSKILWKGKAKKYSRFDYDESQGTIGGIWNTPIGKDQNAYTFTYNNTSYTTASPMSIFNQPDSEIAAGRENALSYGRVRVWDSCYLSANVNHDLSGNIMSLLYGDDFIGQIELTDDYTFAYLFCGSTKLLDAEKLCLPATYITTGCYTGMFHLCTNLKTTPMICAKKLYAYSFANMFAYCSRLKNVQKVEIEELCQTKDKGEANFACAGMFHCAGELSQFTNNVNNNTYLYTNKFNKKTEVDDFGNAITSDAYKLYVINNYDDTDLCIKWGYNSTIVLDNITYYTWECLTGVMESNCYLLTTTNKYDILNDECITPEHLDIGFSSCAGVIHSDNSIDYNQTDDNQKLTLVHVEKNATIYPNPFIDISNISLKADKLTPFCYAFMFAGAKINKIPDSFLPATFLSLACYFQMFGYSYYLHYLPKNLLPAEYLAAYCYSLMFEHNSLLSTVPEDLLSSNSLHFSCYEYMFNECTSLIKAPTLPAKVALKNSYFGMFNNCTNLKYVEMLVEECTDGGANDYSFYAYNMLNNVSTLDDGTCAFICRYDINPNLASLKPANWNMYHNKYYNNPLTIRNLDSATATISISIETVNTYMYGASLDICYLDEYGNYMNDQRYTINNNTKTINITVEANKQIEIFGYVNRTTSMNSYTVATTTLLSNINRYTGLHIAGTKNFEAYGNIRSLSFARSNDVDISTKNWESNSRIRAIRPGDFAYLFASTLNNQFNTSNLKIANNLYLPTSNATSLYYHAFVKSKIEKTPIMPATTVYTTCYCGMYQECNNLKTAEILPAKTLANYCYANMFASCGNLIVAPVLPATTFNNVTYPYHTMFATCNNLSYIKVLLINNSNAFPPQTNFVKGVSNDGIFIYNKNITSVPIGNANYRPSNFDCYKDGQIPAMTYEIESIPLYATTNNSISTTISLYNDGQTINIPDSLIYSNGYTFTGDPYLSTATTLINNSDIMYQIIDREDNSIYFDTINPKIIIESIPEVVDFPSNPKFCQYTKSGSVGTTIKFEGYLDNYDARTSSQYYSSFNGQTVAGMLKISPQKTHPHLYNFIFYDNT